MRFDLRHALDVAGHFSVGSTEWMVALLHDAVEDGAISQFELLLRVPVRVSEAVDALTRQEDEEYADYIQRVGMNPLAARVKLADLAVNLARMDAEHESLRPRYERAIQQLDAALTLKPILGVRYGD